MNIGSELLTTISGITLVAIAILLAFLGKLNDDHWYHRANQAAGKGLKYIGEKVAGLRYRLGFGSLRLSVHYLMHQLLVRLRGLLTTLTKHVRGLERTNREKARSVKKEKKEHTHLNQIVAHQKATSLTEEQKSELKESKLSAE